MRDFSPFFNPLRKRVKIDPEAAELNASNEVLDFADTTYYSKFLDWLDREATRPLQAGSHQDMIISAVRANTLREIRSTLVSRVEQARAATMGDEEQG